MAAPADVKAEVLVVDDHSENLLLMERILERPGLTLVKARSGPEALEKVQGHDIAIAVLDVQMPIMDGFELASKLRGLESFKSTPIIFVTAMSRQEKYVFKGYESGAVDYLFKPIEPEIIRSKVSVFLEMHRQRRLIEEQSALLAAKLAALEDALEHIKILRGILPICAQCKRIRNDKGYWEQVEHYICQHSEAGFSHGICPDCLRKDYPELADEVLNGDKERNQGTQGSV